MNAVYPKRTVAILTAAIVIAGMAVGLSACQQSAPKSALCNNEQIEQSFAKQQSDVQVRGCGVVKSVLKDDTKGSRHQRFIVRLEGVQQTVLMAHNIDLAPRIDTLKQGDWVDFYGEYEYTKQGGVVHWTHKDPAARRQDGYIDHQGQRYQ